LLTREAIALLVPHQGAMCLLDRALAWDAESIHCEAERHRDPANPLRRDGILPAVCGVEFALQAMALHGALLAGMSEAQWRGVVEVSLTGFVSSLRDLALGAERLDDIEGALRIEAVALAAEARGFIYRFDILGAGRSLLSGQAAVILPEGA
jgi:predicted hotdog family 3-hydroxylacyl-ACP dehydratase